MLRYARNISGHLTSLYDDTFKSGDPRVELWPLMASPMPTIGLCLAYVCLVKWAGPCLMKGRQPYNIRTVMVVYNFAMVLLSLYLFLKLGIYGWFGSYNYRCQPVDYSGSDTAIEMANLCWLYFFSKFLEFIDTFFFVARKKFSHVSTLHVIHHGVMPISTWFGVKFTPGGHSTFFAFINSFVHIILYMYYEVSALVGSTHMMRWKKYLTVIQMVQFLAIFVHSFQLLFRECDYPRGFMWWIGFHAVLFWFLFYDFYKNAYNRPKEKAVGTSDHHRLKGHCNGHCPVVRNRKSESCPNGEQSKKET